MREGLCIRGFYLEILFYLLSVQTDKIVLVFGIVGFDMHLGCGSILVVFRTLFLPLHSAKKRSYITHTLGVRFSYLFHPHQFPSAELHDYFVHPSALTQGLDTGGHGIAVDLFYGFGPLLGSLLF